MKSEKTTSKEKINLVEQARTYYRGNPKSLKLIDEFDKWYRPNDCLRWCFRSPFPCRPLRCALMSRRMNLLSTYQFLILDATRLLQQQSKHCAQGQVYRGLKLSNELVDMFESHTGELVCANGFFICSKARNNELQLATTAGYRTDLASVLFKIDLDGSARYAEVTMENGSSMVVFDVATSFRVVCVNRGSMCIIKMKTAADDGQKLALEYKRQHQEKTIKTLLEQLSTVTPCVTALTTTELSAKYVSFI